MTVKPAQVFGLSSGVLEPGRDADITIIDLEHEVAVDPTTFLSKSSNTPFGGWKLTGMANNNISRRQSRMVTINKKR